MRILLNIIFALLLTNLVNAQIKTEKKDLPLNKKDKLKNSKKIIIKDNEKRKNYTFNFSEVSSPALLKNGDSSLSIVTSSIGQEGAAGTKIEPVVMPSPNSSTLINLITEDVDLYTGRTNVNLPLYTLQCNNISIPIALQTSVNSHKVNDFGSWVGLGWNLNAGGSITRVMKNLPDEFTGTISPDFPISGYGYLELKPNAPGNIDLSNFDNLSLDDKRFIVHRGNWAIKNNLPDWGLDLQPDDFYFNFGNYSGRFVFDQDGKVNLIPKTNLNITPTIDVVAGHKTITGFTIFSENGFKYEFGNYALNAVEDTKLKTTSQTILYTYRAKQLIDYPYNSSGPYNLVAQDPANNNYYIYDRTPYLIGNYALAHNPGPGQSQYATGLYNFDKPEMNDNTQYCNYPSTWLLTKITAPTNEWISFNYVDNGLITYQSNRSFSANLPDFIDIRIPPTTGLIFGFSYFISPLPPVDDPGRKIMKYPAHQTFTVSYSNIELKSKKLQSIITSQNNTVSFLANIPRVDFPNDNNLSSFTVLNSQNQVIKKVNFNYQIQTNADPIESYKFHYRQAQHFYNTGGDYIGMGPTGIETLIPPQNEIKPFPIESYNTKRTFLSSVQEEANGVNSPPYTFEYDNSAQLPFRTSIEQDKFGFANYNPSKYPFETSTYSVFYPYNSTNSGNVPSQPDNLPVSYFQTDLNSNAWPPRNLQANKNASPARLKAGVLKKITYPTGGYKEFILDFNGNSTAWNGLRVSEINEYESPTALPIKKSYSYGTFVPNDNAVTKYYLPEGVTASTGAPIIYTRRVFLNSERINSENTTKGANGGYSWAEVSQFNNGKQRSEFFTALDYANVPNTVYNISSYFNPNIQNLGYPYPFPLPNTLDWKRGLLKADYIYPNTGSTPLKSTTYNYELSGVAYGINNATGLATIKYNVIDPVLLGSPWQWSWLAYGKTTYTSVWSTLLSKTERIYDQNGANYSESTQEYSYRKYSYNNKDYLLQYQQKDLKNSRNEQTVGYSKYPFDYTSTNISDPFLAGIQNLKTRNVFNTKVEQFSFLQDQNGNNKRYFGGILNKYHADKPIVKEVYKLRTNGLMSTFIESNAPLGTFNYDPNYNSEVQFPLYDANGRILEQNKTNDIKETYIWDYNKAYPVAKVVNANQNEIAFSSFEADEAGANITFNPARIINDPAGAFTGKKYYNLESPTAIAININSPGKEYKLTFWYKSVQSWPTPIIIHNTTTIAPFPTPIKIRNGWKYYEYIVPASFTGSLYIVKGAGNPDTYLDELRFYPALSQMNTYTFDPLIGMTSETDVNGKTVYYEYDALNRLSIVKNEDKDIVKTICYNFAGQSIPCAVNICAAPVINSIIRDGFNATINFTAPAGSTGCSVKITDINSGSSSIQAIGCNSPVQIQLATKTQPYKIEIISYSSDCPGGTYSLPWNI